jgi:hypothetical protein
VPSEHHLESPLRVGAAAHDRLYIYAFAGAAACAVRTGPHMYPWNPFYLEIEPVAVRGAYWTAHVPLAQGLAGRYQ